MVISSSGLPLLRGTGVLTSEATLLHGANFPDDHNDFHLLKQLSRVKQAMAAGGTVVLVSNDQLYTPLYVGQFAPVPCLSDGLRECGARERRCRGKKRDSISFFPRGLSEGCPQPAVLYTYRSQREYAANAEASHRFKK